jgi:large subunit ribosomal protein L28
MAKCELTGKGPAVKNLVSHSNIKTKKWVQPNVHQHTFYSDALKVSYTFKTANSTSRTVDHIGSFDKFILSLDPKAMSKKALRIRHNIRKATGAKK